MKTWLAMLMLCLFCLPAQAEQITEQDIQHLLAQVDAAIQQQDANALAALLDEQVEIVMTIHDGAITDTLHYNRAEYIARLKDSWLSVRHYQYRRELDQLELHGDRAVVTNRVLETMTIDEQTVQIQSKEVAEVVKSAGQLHVIRITSQVGM